MSAIAGHLASAKILTRPIKAPHPTGLPKTFETLTKAPGDKILAPMGEYAADQRPTKIDLGVGVYKDEKGVTPVMKAVRKAEERILSNEKTKTYLGIAGNKGYGNAVLDLVLADSVDRARVRIAQAPGGTG